jgi:hypothetical protein
MTEDISKLPDRIKNRLAVMQKEIDQIISGAEALLKTQLPDPVQLEFKNSAPRDVLTEYERAQSISFLTRFDQLPQNYTVKIVEQQGAYFTGNMAFIRHALNEFRPLIQNEQDSVYYQKIHAVWYAMLVLDDPKKGTTIRVFDKCKNDVTQIFTRWLNERNESISFVLRPLDYKYLYMVFCSIPTPTILNGSFKTTHRGSFIMCCGNMFIFSVSSAKCSPLTASYSNS